MNTPPAANTSCLYTGTVMHRRFKPKQHRLSYRVFWTLIDLDELPDLPKKLRLLSHERFNLFGFYNTDHGDGSDTPLRAQAEAHLAKAGIDLNGGAIRLLCMPRVLGFTFNPISIYYCSDRNGGLKALIYEVHNTFGERHSYLIPIADDAAQPLEQRCLKSFYVSPFIDMHIAYTFRVTPPAARIGLVIDGADPQGRVIVASLTGERRSLTDTALLKAFFAFPLLTLKVVAGIHWEAAKLWIKGMRLRPRPSAPPPVTIVPALRASGNHGAHHV